MATVRITEQAWSDLEAVLDYYDRSAPGFSEVFEDEVLEKIRRLGQFPRMGRAVPEIGDEALRELIHRSYRIVYYVDADGPRGRGADDLSQLAAVRRLGFWKQLSKSHRAHAA